MEEPAQINVTLARSGQLLLVGEACPLARVAQHHKVLCLPTPSIRMQTAWSWSLTLETVKSDLHSLWPIA
eukprot:1988196-Pleurochrysis_carterae.AAC.1